MAAKKKKTTEDYHQLAKSRGFHWIGPEVSTTKTLTTWECSKGHQWKAIYNNIQQGRDCPQCMRRKTHEDFYELARKRNFQWIGGDTSSMDIDTRWKCAMGHEWIGTYRDILRGDDCPVCGKNESISQISDKVLDAEEIEQEDSKQYNDNGEKFQERKKPTQFIDWDVDVPEPISLDWWEKRSIDFLRPFFKYAKSLIRVSTGYFSIQGYGLLKPYIGNKRFCILVGYDERSRQDVRKLLLDEIMDDLSKWHENRRETVLNLVKKLEVNEFRIVDARTREKDHSKIFIFEDDYVVGGSINLSINGLLFNHEGDLAISRESVPDRVDWWCTYYEKYWNDPDTQDISQLLLELLLKWLKLSKPWDIYLKTIQILVPEDKPSPPRESYRMPVEFQMVVVNRAIRQLNDWRGAMIVASTGLGKTVMATHISYELLHLQKKILNVMVIAPNPVKKEWNKRLLSAGISAAIFTRNLLDIPLSKSRNQTKLKELLEALAELDDKWLIVIDESQHFKNRVRGVGGERLSFTRLIERVNEKKCLVLLLTATPYATEVNNINHQLLLLPHTNPKKHTHQQAFEGLEPTKQYLNSWEVDRVEEMVNLPVGTVINAPYVAQNFAISSDEGDYLLFGETKKYIPRIQVNKVEVPVILEKEISSVYDAGYFRHESYIFPSRGKWIHTTASIENEVIVSWGSSPWALKEVIEKTILQEGGYDRPFIFSFEERFETLNPILAKVKTLDYSDDEKFKRLSVLINQLRKGGHKVIVFSERLATTVYLEQGLRKIFPHLRIANTVYQDGEKFYTKQYQEVEELICNFAPKSNLSESGSIPEDLYDVFLTTDAFSEGINLQDASAVIHYDIAWTPDNIIQRAGRILRFWPEPRMVYLYIFAGKYQVDSQQKYESLKMEKRLSKLISRTKEAEKFTEITIIPENSQQFDTLRGITSIQIETIGQIRPQNLEDERFEVSPFLIHLTEYKKNSHYAKEIPDDISSALYSNRVRRPKMYVLVKYQNKYEWMVYDTEHKRADYIEEDELLDMIKCTQDTEPAMIDANEIEEYRQECINLWCNKKQLGEKERGDVKHICSLYLSPKDVSAENFIQPN